MMLLIKIILDLSLVIVLSLLFVNLINWLYSIMDKKLMEKAKKDLNFLTEEDIKILQEGLDLEEIAKKIEEWKFLSNFKIIVDIGLVRWYNISIINK